MRILHTSDWHLGQFFYAKNRANEHQQFLDWLLVQVSEHNIDAVIVAGDIFDTGAPPSYAREMYFGFIAKLHQQQCQLIVVAGNHDSVAMLGETQTLLANFNTHIIPAVSDDITKQVFPINNSQGQAKAVVCAIPFIRPRDVIKSKAGQSAQDKNLSLKQAIKNHYQQLFAHAEQLATTLFEDGSEAENLNSEQLKETNRLPIIATGHLTALGVTSSDSVRDIYIGTLEAFPASDFPPADYIALGHIHQPQKIAKTEHVRYCGSPIPLSFDELNYDKKVIFVDFSKQTKADQTKAAQIKTAENTPEITELSIPRFQPMALLKVKESDFSDLASAIKALLTEYKNNATFTDDSVIWLAIEVQTNEYLSDLSQRIERITEQYPVEVLFIKRKSTAEKHLAVEGDNVTLSELSVDDVFAARLAQEHWETEDELSTKQRLELLFQQTVEQLSQGEPADNADDTAKGVEVASVQEKAKSAQDNSEVAS